MYCTVLYGISLLVIGNAICDNNKAGRCASGRTKGTALAVTAAAGYRAMPGHEATRRCIDTCIYIYQTP